MHIAGSAPFGLLFILASLRLGISLKVHQLSSDPHEHDQKGRQSKLKPLELGEWKPSPINFNFTSEVSGHPLSHTVASSRYFGCNSTSCFVNSAKVQEEHGKELVLILGCSVDVNAIGYFCGAATGVPVEAFVGSAIMSYLVHCDMGDFKLVYSFHPGASAPPYSYQYNAAFGTTQEIVTRTQKDVKAKFGRDPTYIVVDSSLWDVANWWQKLGSPPYPYPVPNIFVRQWCIKDLPDLLTYISSAFGGVPIAYRTPPTIFANPNAFGLSAMTVEQMVNCVELGNNGWGRIYGEKFGLIDFHHFVDQILQSSGNAASRWYKDALHPGPQLSLMYINGILMWIQAHKNIEKSSADKKKKEPLELFPKPQ